MQEVQEISSNIRKVASEASVVNQFKLNQQAIKEEFTKMIQAKQTEFLKKGNH